jgi:PadR family transcriptional regulator PadR
MRMTLNVAVVVRACLGSPSEPRYGYDLMRECGFGSGKLYPILDRLERSGWLDRRREEVDPSVAGRPPRVLYRLTAEGERAARRELAQLGERLGMPARDTIGLRPGWGTM